MDRVTMARQEELRARIGELVGDVRRVGTLRRQAADLGSELGDYGVVMAMDRLTDGEWMPPAVRYKYAHFFTHWVVLAITRIADRQRDSTSIPVLVRRLNGLRQEGELRRDRWVERMEGLTHWREARDDEERERIERLIAKGGGAIWSRIGPGEEAARLSELWNRLTGRQKGEDGHRDDVEEWILDSAKRPLEHPDVQVVRAWRDTNVAHQDIRETRMESAGYEVFPMKPLVRAYWAVMKAAHRVLLLADGSGLYGLYPTPQFSVAQALSGGKLDQDQTDTIEEQLMAHAQKWDRLLRDTEERWYGELMERRWREAQER